MSLIFLHDLISDSTLQLGRETPSISLSIANRTEDLYTTEQLNNSGDPTAVIIMMTVRVMEEDVFSMKLKWFFNFIFSNCLPYEK